MLFEDVRKLVIAYNAGNNDEMAEADEGIRFWIKEIEDHAGKSAFNRASDHAAQMEAIAKTLYAIEDSLNAINGSASNYRAVEADIRVLLASALRSTTRAKVAAEFVTKGGGN